jgi:hypothetical protein
LERAVPKEREQLAGAYQCYASKSKESAADSSLSGQDAHNTYVASRSKPVVIAPIRNPRTGTTSYRVTGTIRGEQRKRVFLNLDDAKACQEQWESERIHGLAAIRPKITWLTNSQLRAAETLFGMFPDPSVDILEVGRHFIRNPPQVSKKVTWKQGYAEYRAHSIAHLSKAHFETADMRGRRFGAWLAKREEDSSTGSKAEHHLAEISPTTIRDYLKSLNIGKKTWNNTRGDLSVIFEWFMGSDRKWITKNPVSEVEYFKNKSLPTPPRERMEIAGVDALMLYLEREKPEWCTFFALALFAGIRPDQRNGEMYELAKCVRRDGVDRYFHKDVIQITEEIAKTHEPREVKIHENLRQWLKKYPPSPESICPGDMADCGLIRAKFKIPHDGLRHTAISAYVARYGSFAEAAQEFGNSEKVIRRHYNRRMTKSEWRAYYLISPRAVQELEGLAA